MEKTPLSQTIFEIFRNNPNKIFNTNDFQNICSYSHQKKCKKELITMILFRLHQKKLVQRTLTQLANGYYYSKDNSFLLNEIYLLHLIPYNIQNKIIISKKLIKKDFGKLGNKHILNLEVIKDLKLYSKYGARYFSQQKTQEFLALLVGFIMCDGSINNKVNRTRFYFRRKEDAENFKKEFLKIFHLEQIKIYPSSDRSCYTTEIIKGKNFAQFLHCIGAPKGNKTITPFLIPDWIFHGKENIKKIFLSTIIGNEGSAPSNGRWRIQFVLSKEEKHIENLVNLINQIRSMLAHFAINTSHIQLRKQKGRKFHTRFYIKGRQNIHKFYKSFSFLYASEKQEVLESLIDSQDVEYAMIT